MTNLLLQRLPARRRPLERIPRRLVRFAQRRPRAWRMIVRGAGGAVAFLDVGDTGGFEFAFRHVRV